MFTTNTLIEISFYKDILDVARNCMRTNRAAMVLGAPRSGGTILGQWLVQTIAAETGEGRTGLYYQIGSDGSYSSLMKSLLRRVTAELPSMTDRDAVTQSLIASFRKVNCRLLYIDEAERASAEAIRELFRIQDLAARADHPFGIMLFGHRQPEEWGSIAELKLGKIRYHRVLPLLSAPEITSILEGWCPSLSGLVDQYDRNDRSARSGVLQIEASGGTRVGVLEDFAEMLKGEYSQLKFGAQVIERILKHADNPVRYLPERSDQLEMSFGEG